MIIPLDYTTLCSTTTIHHQSDHTTHYTLLNNHHTSLPLNYTTLCLTTTIHHQSDHTTRLHYTLLSNNHHTSLCLTTTIHHQSDHTTQLQYTLLNNHHTSSEWSYHSTTLHSAQQPPYIIRVIIPLNYTTLCLTTTIHHQSDHTTRLHYTLLNNHHTSAEWSYHSTTLHSAQQPPYIIRVIIPLDYTTLCLTTTIHQQSDHTTQLHYTLLKNIGGPWSRNSEGPPKPMVFLAAITAFRGVANGWTGWTMSSGPKGPEVPKQIVFLGFVLIEGPLDARRPWTLSTLSTRLLRPWTLSTLSTRLLRPWTLSTLSTRLLRPWTLSTLSTRLLRTWTQFRYTATVTYHTVDVTYYVNNTLSLNTCTVYAACNINSYHCA